MCLDQFPEDFLTVAMETVLCASCCSVPQTSTVILGAGLGPGKGFIRLVPVQLGGEA